MLKLVSIHIQAHLNAFLQILEYFSQICLGPLARESPCIKTQISGNTIFEEMGVNVRKIRSIKGAGRTGSV